MDEASPSLASLPEPHPLFVSELCAAYILSFTDPRTICALASLNKTFLAASVADVVWAKMLPANYVHTLSLVDEDERSSLESAGLKRQLYFRLCRSVSLRGGKQKYWLDRATGGECYILSAKELGIAWGNSPQYWKWKPCSGSWFPDVAFLENVCWFLVEGTFHESLKPGKYVVSFRMQLPSRRPAYGWHNIPIKLSLRNSFDGSQVDSQRFFDRRFPESDPPVFSPQNGDSLPAGTKWVECDVGLFTVEKDDGNASEVHFSMQETEWLRWKSGLFLDGVLVRPFDIIPQARERAEAILRKPGPDYIDAEDDVDEVSSTDGPPHSLDSDPEDAVGEILEGEGEAKNDQEPGSLTTS